MKFLSRSCSKNVLLSLVKFFQRNSARQLLFCSWSRPCAEAAEPHMQAQVGKCQSTTSKIWAQHGHKPHAVTTFPILRVARQTTTNPFGLFRKARECLFPSGPLSVKTLFRVRGIRTGTSANSAQSRGLGRAVPRLFIRTDTKEPTPQHNKTPFRGVQNATTNKFRNMM